MAVNFKEDNIPLNVSWSDEDDCFIATCDQYDRVIGIGESKEEAIKVFYELLEDWLNPDRPVQEPKNKGGRPKKSNVRIYFNVQPVTKANIDYLSLEKNVNQGQILDEIVKFYMDNR